MKEYIGSTWYALYKLSPSSGPVPVYTTPIPVSAGGTGDSSLGAGLPLFGAGIAPITTGTLSGNTTELGTVSGSLTLNHCVSVDSHGNLIDAGFTCSALLPSITIGQTPISAGSPNGVLYDAAGVVGNLSTASSGVLATSSGGVPSITQTLPGGVQGNITAFGTVTSGAINGITGIANTPVSGSTGAFTNLSATTMGLFGLNAAPQFVAGNQTGTNPWLKTLYEQNPGDISSILGLYSGNTQAFLGVSDRVSAATDPTGATAGQLTAGIFAMMTNNGSILDATPLESVCKNAANATICTGLNVILTGGSGLSGTADEIFEGDLQVNSAPSNSNGMQMIAFLEPYGNAFALSSADGVGTFQTGFGIAGIAAGGEGILFGSSPAQTMDVGIDFGSGDIYSAGAIRLYASTSGAAQQGLYLIGGTGNNAVLYQDSSHNLLWNIASGEYAIRNNAGTSNLFVLHPTGDALLGTGTALATTATTGYTFIPAMAGTPTGVPTYGSAGYSAIVNDTTDHKLCWYEFPNTAWKCATGS